MVRFRIVEFALGLCIAIAIPAPLDVKLRPQKHIISLLHLRASHRWNDQNHYRITTNTHLTSQVPKRKTDLVLSLQLSQSAIDDQSGRLPLASKNKPRAALVKKSRWISIRNLKRFTSFDRRHGADVFRALAFRSFDDEKRLAASWREIKALRSLSSPSKVSLKRDISPRFRAALSWSREENNKKLFRANGSPLASSSRHAVNTPAGSKEQDTWATALRAGLTLDECESTSECRKDRQCFDFDTNSLCDGGSSCRCLPDEPVFCNSSADCPPGEGCAALQSGETLCISQGLIEDTPATTEEPSTSAPPTSTSPTSPTTTSPPRRGGLTLDDCNTNANCRGDRQCYDVDAEALCKGGSNCVCVPLDPISCESAADCPPGEGCVQGTSTNAVCVSNDFIQDSGTSTVGPPTSTPLSSPPPSPEGGLTGDMCNSMSNCRGDRECIDIDSEEICSGASVCFCLPLQLVECMSDIDCPAGEECFKFPTDDEFCISSAALAAAGDPYDEPTSTPGAMTPPGNGLTGDECSTDEDCQGSRQCQIGDELCSGSENCLCIPEMFIPCIEDVDCPAGEVCLDIGSEDICVSKTFVGVSETPTESPEPAVSPEVEENLGLTADNCNDTSECQGDRTCLNEFADPCAGDDFCICLPSEIISCSSDEDCPEDEICYVLDSQGDVVVCLSRTFTPTL